MIFKKNSKLPANTPKYNDFDLKMELKNPKGLLTYFLDGAAKLSSHDDFRRMNTVDKIKTLMAYTQGVIPWTKAARIAENAGIETYDELICAGIGVCRHNSRLLATILSEAGYAIRLVSYEFSDSGHMWLEADMPLENGNLETYIVDPSNGTFVEPFWKVKKMVKDSPSSFEAQWYLQPDRIYLSPISPDI